MTKPKLHPSIMRVIESITPHEAMIGEVANRTEMAAIDAERELMAEGEIAGLRRALADFSEVGSKPWVGGVKDKLVRVLSDITTCTQRWGTRVARLERCEDTEEDSDGR